MRTDGHLQPGVSREQDLGVSWGSYSAILGPQLVPRALAEGGEILYGVGRGVGGNIVCDTQADAAWGTVGAPLFPQTL